MAAYAAVAQLKNYPIISRKLKRWNAISYTLGALQRLDEECFRGIDRSEIHELEAQITDAAWKLLDALDSYRISQGVAVESLAPVSISFFETAEKFRWEYARALEKENSRVAEDQEDDTIIHSHDVAANSATVGSSALSEEIISWLLDANSKYNNLLIWGMAGIGKTHLARDIYHHPLIAQHFDLRLWVTIGPIQKDIKLIYVDILAQIERKPKQLFKEKGKGELRDILVNILRGRPYLIVFDDVWNVNALTYSIQEMPWPSKFLITSRIRDEGFEWRVDYTLMSMPFLSDEESWDLLSRVVFAEEEPFPTQLEKPGRKIAQICEGLPLLIIAVADILRGLDQTEECWNKVADNTTSLLSNACGPIYKVLISSYDYLDQMYKACFLYMGVFPQSRVISATKLSRLLGVEAISEPDNALKYLASISLAIICKRSLCYGIKYCKLHPVYWFVCITEARKNKLFHVLIKLTDVFVESPRRLSVQNSMLFGLKEVRDSMAASTSLTRSLLFTGEDHQYPVEIPFNTMLLLKVLEALAIRFYEFPDAVSNLILLRYLALTHNGEVTSSISKLQRLEVLILRHHHNIKLVQKESATYLPEEIWDLQELAYLQIMGSKLPDPSCGQRLPDLSRLYVNADSCTEGVLRGTPTLKKLGIKIELWPEGGTGNPLRCLEHTGLLNELESLTCVVANPRLSSQVVDHLSNLAQSLKKLCLQGLGYPWEYISPIGSLPNLQVLKLRCSAFRGVEWEIKDGEFSKLEYLLLEDIDVARWTVRGSLPLLDHLVVRHCYKLKMIPCRGIPKMYWIEVDECSPSLVEYVERIKGNSHSHLKVEINYSWNL